MIDELRVPAKWTDDCQGKKDYDGELVSLSTRYWPRGGGFSVWDGSRFQENDERPDIKPSAKSSILLRHGDDDYIELVVREFEGETHAEVAVQVEAWAREQYARVVAAMRREFAAPAGDKD